MEEELEEEIGKAKSLIKRVETAIVKGLVALARARLMGEVQSLAQEAEKFKTRSDDFLGILKTIGQCSPIYLERIPTKEVRTSAKPAVRKPPALGIARTATVPKKPGPEKAAAAEAEKQLKTKVAKKPAAKKPVVKKLTAAEKKKQKLIDDIRQVVIVRHVTDTEKAKKILDEEFGHKNVSGRTINGVRQTGVSKKKQSKGLAGEGHRN